MGVGAWPTEAGRACGKIVLARSDSFAFVEVCFRPCGSIRAGLRALLLFSILRRTFAWIHSCFVLSLPSLSFRALSVAVLTAFVSSVDR